jgi:AraC-like DNA-binding protein
MDPFLDLIRLLRPSATLWGGLDGFGRWGLSFQKWDDLLICWVERGECLLLRPGRAPVRLARDDFVLIRASTPFTLASDPTARPVDIEAAVAGTGKTWLSLGEGEDSPMTLRAGRFVFDTANEDMLMELLPQLVHIAAADAASDRLRALLTMNESEFRRPGPGSEFVISRLIELILVEILRTPASRMGAENTGLLAGLADPIVARALSAMHGDVARDWTVAALARLCGVSRSSFAARFRDVVGKGPIEYLLRWRMARAKDELRLGKLSLGEIALAIGFRSSSAFNTAFSRAVGVSPRRFAASAR